MRPFGRAGKKSGSGFSLGWGWGQVGPPRWTGSYMVWIFYSTKGGSTWVFLVACPGVGHQERGRGEILKLSVSKYQQIMKTRKEEGTNHLWRAPRCQEDKRHLRTVCSETQKKKKNLSKGASGFEPSSDFGQDDNDFSKRNLGRGPVLLLSGFWIRGLCFENPSVLHSL